MKQEFINYSRLFNKVKNSKELNAEEKLILSEIISVTLDGKPYQYTNPQIANWLGLTESTVAKRLKSLRKKDFIFCTNRNVPPIEGQGRYFKQRTITIVDLEKWIERKENIPTKTRKTPPDFFFELTPKEQENFASIAIKVLELDNKEVTQDAIFELIENIGKDEVLRILKS